MIIESGSLEPKNITEKLEYILLSIQLFTAYRGSLHQLKLIRPSKYPYSGYFKQQT
jgi:hypothetical protein